MSTKKATPTLGGNGNTKSAVATTSTTKTKTKIPTTTTTTTDMIKKQQQQQQQHIKPLINATSPSTTKKQTLIQSPTTTTTKKRKDIENDEDEQSQQKNNKQIQIQQTQQASKKQRTINEQQTTTTTQSEQQQQQQQQQQDTFQQDTFQQPTLISILAITPDLLSKTHLPAQPFEPAFTPAIRSLLYTPTKKVATMAAGLTKLCDKLSTNQYVVIPSKTLLDEITQYGRLTNCYIKNSLGKWPHFKHLRLCHKRLKQITSIDYNGVLMPFVNSIRNYIDGDDNSMPSGQFIHLVLYKLYTLINCHKLIDELMITTGNLMAGVLLKGFYPSLSTTTISMLSVLHKCINEQHNSLCNVYNLIQDNMNILLGGANNNNEKTKLTYASGKLCAPFYQMFNKMMLPKHMVLVKIE
ncbi:hypothetical protein SAMD00019534_109590 [Acytostelium subglobosum LB1]|uniref:hypothetical protein n=1 Tax=Acytostelium subglobosum LB1 TaxID=1410327 RepID=UPI00064505C2|nr:hypothetical protein SAMD00019534_109590 [Acytostelium subglobosum LB1]GAM27783.1 hypothetical protein SAMD00019534_109590 [Acytostelium subglobosum LB1]|eukprot:XP_012749442.1 hypothetical protein SAMD00019534_109590 [Acytostelium subglobosum LB1]